MKIKKYIATFVLFAGLLTTTSCDDLFRDSPINKLPENMIWEDPKLLDGYVLPWYRKMNNGFSVYMPTNTLLHGISREFLPWFGDQITVSKSDWYNTSYGGILQCDPKNIRIKGLSLWTTYYEQIRSINLLFENQGKIPEGTHKDRILGEAHFFRAYYYYMLLRQFGGPILLKEVYDPLKNPQKYPRASYEEMVEFITQEAILAESYLPDTYGSEDIGRATKGAAIMLRAKTYFWVAGDHFQNQEKDYLGFPDNRSEAMLISAKEAYDELMKLPYDLVQIDGDSQEQIKEGYRQIFLTKNSIESIWEVQHSDNGDYSSGFGHKLDREASSSYYGGTTAAYTPTQNHVDEYGMQEGKTYDPSNPYENRDYRFYANILYDGCVYNNHTMEIHYTKVDGKEVAGADLTPYGASESAAVTKTGYYMGKFVKEGEKINSDPTYASSQNYIIWRFAEVLLDYAEIDFKQGRTGDALEKVNRIRRRAHMHELTSITWEAIMNERRVEMAFEETTYWDFYRYNIAFDKMNGKTNPLKAMKIVKEEGKPTTYTISNINRFPSRVRYFEDRQYYYPIAWDDKKYHGVEQNPDWTEG
ncbi:RagB/SusD family nutrient uptake outer membrane protein [Dysgonomonas sp. 520]|uniref:RagB/SusD family nutrient uptake outer membrane protein n=1 Tax=Dysgonomonas sp. 520 TaxID=2302931 RepID=UPI0013D0D59C|nr:RagB/SusD family nutrient uptake outer membrane protein [Dysgonomonas sp. 520]NDW09671.1 RagB/SusD family nutrient uptake outer membrane protein [Dysgonomonas sp. 520]